MRGNNKQYHKIIANLQSKIDSCRSSLLSSIRSRNKKEGLTILNPSVDYEMNPAKIFCKIMPVKGIRSSKHGEHALTPEPFKNIDSMRHFRFSPISNPDTSHREFKIRLPSTASRKLHSSANFKRKRPALPTELIMKKL